jgi:hypothetical protein
MTITDASPPRLWLRKTPFPMGLFDLCATGLGVIAFVAGIVLLAIDTPEVIGSSLIAFAIGIVPVALYTSHERRDQETKYREQVERLSGLDFVVDPPRMSQVENAADVGKVMFAQTGPNVSQQQSDEFTERIRRSALALGGSVPHTFEALLEDGTWPRCNFQPDGTPLGLPEVYRSRDLIKESIAASVDWVVSEAFHLGWLIAIGMSFVTIKKMDHNHQKPYLDEAIFNPQIINVLGIVSRGSTLGPKVCRSATTIFDVGRNGGIELEDFRNFLIFLHCFTASLSRAYPWDSTYGEANSQAEKLLDKICQQPSSSTVSADYKALADCFLL